MEKRKSLIAEGTPNVKQQRPSDTNYRYDKMMETMSLTSIYPQNKKTKQWVGTTVVPRKRARTPEAAPPRKYSRKDFPLKVTDVGSSGWLNDQLHTPNSDVTNSPTIDCSVGKKRTSRPQKHLPKWLAQTFADLPQNHPLRCLLPVGHYGVDPSETPLSLDSTAAKTTRGPTSELDQLLSAFDESDAFTSPTLVSGKVHHDFDLSDGISSCSDDLQVSRSLCIPSESAIKSPYVRPFATPGPASTISCPPVPQQLTLDAIDIALLCSPQPPYSEDHPPVHSSPAVDFDVSPDDNYYMITGAPASPYPVLETLPKSLLPGGGNNVDFEAVVPSGLNASPGPYHHAPSLPAHSESHIEGDVNSDPYSELSSLDVGELDFQWIAFDRSGLHQDYAPKERVDAQSNDESHQQYQEDKSPSPDDTSRFHFQKALDLELEPSGTR